MFDMLDNNVSNDEKTRADDLGRMGRSLPFFEGVVRRAGYSKHITIPKDYAFTHHLNEGRRVHVYIVPIDDAAEISGVKE